VDPSADDEEVVLSAGQLLQIPFHCGAGPSGFEADSPLFSKVGPKMGFPEQ
jgi:hypothetical protein